MSQLTTAQIVSHLILKSLIYTFIFIRPIFPADGFFISLFKAIHYTKKHFCKDNSTAFKLITKTGFMDVIRTAVAILTRCRKRQLSFPCLRGLLLLSQDMAGPVSNMLQFPCLRGLLHIIVRMFFVYIIVAVPLSTGIVTLNNAIK